MTALVFTVGVATVTMIDANVGAGQMQRAIRIGWTGAAIGGSIAGTVGTLGALFAPQWMGLFTADPQIKASGASYLATNQVAYALFGRGLRAVLRLARSRQRIGPVPRTDLAAGATCRLGGNANLRTGAYGTIRRQCRHDRMGRHGDHIRVLAREPKTDATQRSRQRHGRRPALVASRNTTRSLKSVSAAGEG